MRIREGRLFEIVDLYEGHYIHPSLEKNLEEAIHNESAFRPHRKTGKTTRLIDAIIQVLFNKNTILLSKNCYPSYEELKYLFKKLEVRLSIEHKVKVDIVYSGEEYSISLPQREYLIK